MLEMAPPITWKSGHGMRVFERTALVLAALLVVVLAIQNRALRTELARAERDAVFPHPGLVVPTFRSVTLEGDSVVVGQNAEGSRQVLFVFRTTCPHCQRTFPAWRRIAAEVRDRVGSTTVYGVSLDPVDVTREFLAAEGFAAPVMAFPDPKLKKLYRVVGVPTTLVIGAQGEVVHARVGVLETERAVDSVLTAARQPTTAARQADAPR